MAHKPFITLAQAQAAMQAMLGKALQTPEQPVAMVIVDDTGNLVAYAHMDNLRLFSKRHAFRKAYTAAITGEDSVAYGERVKSRGLTLSEWGGDANLTPGQGGIAVRSREGVLMGGIGVGGYPSGQADEELARVGLHAMNL
jgi:4'-phosphopantetheinyl transferase